MDEKLDLFAHTAQEDDRKRSVDMDMLWVKRKRAPFHAVLSKNKPAVEYFYFFSYVFNFYYQMCASDITERLYSYIASQVNCGFDIALVMACPLIYQE